MFPIEIVNRGRTTASGSSRPGCSPNHCEMGYEQGALGRDPNVPAAPLSLPDFDRHGRPTAKGLVPPPRRTR